jgi:hypothetical protein
VADPKMTFQVKPAKGLIRAYMRLCGFDGWASAWGVAYIIRCSERPRRSGRGGKGRSR